MLIQNYERAGRLFNSNLAERCTTEALDAYRGELIIVDGEVADSSGRRKPPLKVLQQVAALGGEDRLRFLSGYLENAADVASLLEKYGADIHADTLCIIFVYDIARAATIRAGEITLQLVPLEEGLVWSELMEHAALEKSDVKNLSSADKVFAVYRELTGFRPRGASTVDLATGLTLGSGKQRALRGPV